MRRVSIGTAVLVFVLGAMACGTPATPRAKPVRIVHAALSGAEGSWQRESAALSGLLRWARNEDAAAPAAIVLVTDFGASATPAAPAASATNPAPAAGQPAAGAAASSTTNAATSASPPPPAAGGNLAAASRFVALLRQQPPTAPVYFVPDVRDVGANVAAALETWRGVVGEIQKEMKGAPGTAQVIDLTSCFPATAAAESSGAGCVAQVQGSQVRLVGHPGLYGASVTALAESWGRTFANAMNGATAGSITILIAPRRVPLDQLWPAGDARRD